MGTHSNGISKNDNLEIWWCFIDLTTKELYTSVLESAIIVLFWEYCWNLGVRLKIQLSQLHISDPCLVDHQIEGESLVKKYMTISK